MWSDVIYVCMCLFDHWWFCLFFLLSNWESRTFTVYVTRTSHHVSKGTCPRQPRDLLLVHSPVQSNAVYTHPGCPGTFGRCPRWPLCPWPLASGKTRIVVQCSHLIIHNSHNQIKSSISIQANEFDSPIKTEVFGVILILLALLHGCCILLRVLIQIGIRSAREACAKTIQDWKTARFLVLKAVSNRLTTLIDILKSSDVLGE